MTTTKNKPTDNPYANRDHERNRENDQLAVAQLFNKVGGELTTVDHHMVGDGLGRAQRLDPNVVRKMDPSPGNPPPPPVPHQVQQPPPQQMPVAVTNAPVSAPAPAPPELIPPPESPVSYDSVPLTDALDEVATVLSQRVNDLEDKVHFHFDKMNNTLQDVMRLHEKIVEQVTKNDVEITIKSSDTESSENTD